MDVSISMRTWAVAAAAVMSSSGQAATADELCPRLRTFETAQMPNSERRWFEVHWDFDKTALLWSLGCRHSEDSFATATCDWLMQNTNQEFSILLPHRIMACHGYRFPKFAYYDWGNIAGTITLRGAKDRRILMDLDFRDLPNGERAARLSVEDADRSYEPRKLPPIQPMSADEPQHAVH